MHQVSTDSFKAKVLSKPVVSSSEISVVIVGTAFPTGFSRSSDGQSAMELLESPLSVSQVERCLRGSSK
jgi:hypothetical protein